MEIPLGLIWIRSVVFIMRGMYSYLFWFSLLDIDMNNASFQSNTTIRTVTLL